jgi:hypothetical protein
LGDRHPIRPHQEVAHVSEQEDAALAALAAGAPVGLAFGNFYVVVTSPDAATIRAVNLLKGRPAEQVGSVTTTPLRIPGMFDWTRLPTGLSAWTVLGFMDELLAQGPCGFRGPAAWHVPAALSADAGGMRTVQVIVPGYACRSNRFSARAMRVLGVELLHITSANRSRHVTGAIEEPAHWRADPLAADFAHVPGFRLIRHPDDESAVTSYPAYAPVSVTVVSFHGEAAGTVETDADGRPVLVVERHGSLPVEEVRRVARSWGLSVKVGESAKIRLRTRSYEEALAPAGAPT